MKKPTDFNNIRQWLIPLLEERGLPIEKLAKQVGVSRTAIYFYIHDQARPSEETMARMCQVLGVPIEEGLKQYVPRRAGRPPGTASQREVVSRR